MAVLGGVLCDGEVLFDQGEKLLFDPFLVGGVVAVLVAQQNGGLFGLCQSPVQVDKTAQIKKVFFNTTPPQCLV